MAWCQAIAQIKYEEDHWWTNALFGDSVLTPGCLDHDCVDIAGIISNYIFFNEACWLQFQVIICFDKGLLLISWWVIT